MASNENIHKSSEANGQSNASIGTTSTTAVQAVSESTSLEPINASTLVNQTSETVHEETSDMDKDVDTTSANDDTPFTENAQGEQPSYLEPILVAMELGQEILESNPDQDEVDTAEECEHDAVPVETNQPDTSVTTQADGSTSNMVTITHEQLANLFANSNSNSAAGNVIVTSLPDGSGPQAGLSIATILQDISGTQTGSCANGSATIQADSTGGSYYLVTQGGTIPIVMQSGGTSNLNLVHTTSGEAFVLNQDSLPETVFSSSAQSESTDNSEKVLNASGQELNESNDELANAAAAVENDKDELQEAVTTAPIPVIHTTGKRRLSNGPRVCDQCNKAFKYPSDLKKHLQIHTDVKKFKCDECNRFFRRFHQLVVHQRIHTGEKPYVCKHCGTAFRHDSTLTMHIRTRHEHKRPFRCEYCEHTFGRLSHLRKHMKKVCGPNKIQKHANTIIQCKYCEAVFSCKIDLRKHVATCEKKECKPKDPSQVTLHVCNICNKDFASPYNVRRHQITHSDERPYVCDYCPKCFKEKSSLTKHMKRVHLEKCKDDSSCELMVSITSHDQQFEVVSVPANDGSLLAAATRNETDDENENSTVDATTLVHVATSVMVEELLHNEDQVQNDAATRTSETASAQQTIYMAESCKDVDTLVSTENVSCLAESDMHPSESLLEDQSNVDEETAMAVDEGGERGTSYNDHHEFSKLDPSSGDNDLQAIELSNVDGSHDTPGNDENKEQPVE